MSKAVLSLCLCVLSYVAASQDTLSLEKALERALQNNHLLKVSRLQRDISKAEVTLGNAGFLPTLGLSAGNSLASNSIRQELVNGTLIERNGAQSVNWNAALSGNWVLYEGGKRHSVYQRLRETYEKADLQTRAEIENTMSRVTTYYYDFVRQQEIEKALTASLSLLQERLKLAEARLANGLSSKADVLLTRVDLNTQQAALLRQSNLKENARLNLLLTLHAGKDEKINLPIRVQLPSTDTALTYSGKSVLAGIAEKDMSIARRNLRETHAAYLPKLSLVSSYSFSQTRNQAGFSLFSRSNGLSAGLSLTWSLFDGFNKNRIRQTASMRVEMSRWMMEETRLNLELSHQRASAQYRIALRILAMEKESFRWAEESYVLAKERYEAGRINLFELKETQKMLEDSRIRSANALYEALVAEVELKRLNGLLNP